MTFDAILAQVLDLLQCQGRVSYRALKRRFDLDDAYREDLKAKLIKAQRLAIDEAGEVLGWAAPPQTQGLQDPATLVTQPMPISPLTTGGVPLFVEELTRMVLESGLLREREDHYEMTGPLPPLAIPSTLHDH
jgi:hypothetical protein